MRKGRILPCLLLLMASPLVMATCSNGKQVQEEKNNEQESVPFPNGSWELRSWKGEDDSAREPEGKSVLRIGADSSYSLNLKVNECQGDLKSPGVERIIFDDPSCTEMCCDTEFQQQMVIDLSKLEHYVLEKDRLILKGKGIRSVWRTAEEVRR